MMSNVRFRCEDTHFDWRIETDSNVRRHIPVLTDIRVKSLRRSKVATYGPVVVLALTQ